MTIGGVWLILTLAGCAALYLWTCHVDRQQREKGGDK